MPLLSQWIKKTMENVSFSIVFLVRETGLEPVHQRYTPLKRARLPIPPLPRTPYNYTTYFEICQGVFSKKIKYFLFVEKSLKNPDFCLKIGTFFELFLIFEYLYCAKRYRGCDLTLDKLYHTLFASLPDKLCRRSLYLLSATDNYRLCSAR